MPLYRLIVVLIVVVCSAAVTIGLAVHMAHPNGLEWLSLGSVPVVLIALLIARGLLYPKTRRDRTKS